MPRTLFWQKSTSSTTAAARPKRPAVASTSIQKRQRSVKDPSAKGSSFSTEEEVAASTKKVKAQGKRKPDAGNVGEVSRDEERPRSSSPPPSPSTESFMVEGLDEDDKYRMVEDEFLAIAQQFTVHLHAAEYKRQQKMAKTRNAETINSISRPVTGKMPDQTKRKLEAIERTKTQRTIVESLVGKKTKNADLSDDSEDDVGLPYFGTSLHGLMDSPSKKKASLKKISDTVTTRAAAGYKQPAQSKSDQSKSRGSPQPRQSARRSRMGEALDGNETESSADDEDLDTAPKPVRLPPKDAGINKASTFVKREVVASVHATATRAQPQSSESTSSFKDVRKTIKLEAPSLEIDSPPKIRNRVSRFEQARQRRVKEEEEEEAKKKLDVIPSFF